jgi:excinuclease ABC subunit C
MLIAVAKGPDRAFLVSGKAIDLEDGSPSSLLLKKIRDEVHRFAISYHKKLRHKTSMESPLEKVHGIGKKRRLELLRHFDSTQAIRSATINDIAELKGFNKHIAKALLAALEVK